MFPHPRYRCQIWLCRTRLLRTRISWPLQFRPARQHSCQPVDSAIDSNMGHGDGSRGDGKGGHTMPMNGANLGDSSESAMIAASLFCSGAQELVGWEERCLPSEICLGGVDFEVVSKTAAAAWVLAPTAGRKGVADDDDDEARRRALRCQTTPGRAGCQEQPDHV